MVNIFKSRWSKWIDIEANTLGGDVYILQYKRHANGKVKFRVGRVGKYYGGANGIKEKLKETDDIKNSMSAEQRKLICDAYIGHLQNGQHTNMSGAYTDIKCFFYDLMETDCRLEKELNEAESKFIKE